MGAILGTNGISYYQETIFPKNVINGIVKANSDINLEVGVTLSCDDFYLEQLREDGALVSTTKKNKKEIFQRYVDEGVKNIEMEAAVIATLCNAFGHKNFATICCTLLDRFKLDQVTSTPKELKEFSDNAESVLFNYLKTL